VRGQFWIRSRSTFLYQFQLTFNRAKTGNDGQAERDQLGHRRELYREHGMENPFIRELADLILARGDGDGLRNHGSPGGRAPNGTAHNSNRNPTWAIPDVSILTAR